MIYSLVTDFNYHSDLKKYCRYCNAGSKGMTIAQGTLLRKVIMFDAVKGVKLSMKQLGEVIILLTEASNLTKD